MFAQITQVSNALVVLFNMAINSYWVFVHIQCRSVVKHKFKEVQMTRDVAIQEINRMIDFYRDVVSKSNYKSADHSIKQAEKALDYLSNQRLCQCEDE